MRAITVTAQSVSESLDHGQQRISSPAAGFGTSRQERRSNLGLQVGEAFNPFSLFDGALVPSEILRNPDLLPSEKLVFARLLQFALENPQPLVYHNEPIWRDGKLVGRVTSGAYGHTIGSALCMGYVECEPGCPGDAMVAGIYEIEVACERWPARPSLRPFYDPSSARIKS